jgi:hypothetical protein
MNSGFLLRFQESAKPMSMEKCAAKLLTVTEHENPNETFIILLAATQTQTFIRPESPDPDLHRCFHVFPR